jgi:hypothetical protein
LFCDDRKRPGNISSVGHVAENGDDRVGPGRSV